MKLSILVVASALSAGSAAQGQPSHCLPTEDTIWSCSAREKVYSVCASKNFGKDTGHLQYRAGPVGAPEFLYPAKTEHPRGLFRLRMLPRGASLAFSNGQYEYEIIEPINGHTAIAVSRNKKGVASIQCAAATNTLTETAVLNRLGAAGLAEQPAATSVAAPGPKARSDSSGPSKVGLKGFYVGQPMARCPENSIPETGTWARAGNTCQVKGMSTVGGQPVSKFFVSYADGRVFLIHALLEGSELEVRLALSDAYGSPAPGPDGEGSIWNLGDELIFLYKEEGQLMVMMANGPDYKRQRALTVKKNRGDL